MNIQTIVNGRRHNGSADLQLVVGPKVLSAQLKTPTQSDLNAMGMTQLKQLGGDLALHQLGVDDDWNHAPQAIHAPLLGCGKPVRILAAVAAQRVNWTLQADAHLITAAANTPANILVLPSRHDETLATYRQRRAHAQAASKANPSLRVVVGLSSMLDDFQPIWTFLASSNDRFIGIDLPGYKGAIPNLKHVASTVQNVSRPPFVVGYNGGRCVDRDPDGGAAALFLRQLGFQTLAHRVYPNFPPKGNPSTRWFDASQGGYVSTTPPTLQGPSHIAQINTASLHAVDLSELLEYRRWDETWKFAAETPVVRQHVRSARFGAYRRARGLLDGTMNSLGL